MPFPGGLPHFAEGAVIKGFGRGSTELGFPTANYDAAVVDSLPQEVQPGIYFGFAKVDRGPVHKMVMSIGWNPFYKNTKKSMETYVMHKFEEDFYGKMLKVVVLGYLRPEKNFANLDELIKAITDDVSQAEIKLEQEEYARFKTHSFFD